MRLPRKTVTYGVVVEDEGVLVLVEVVEGALWDAVLDLDRALDVLLVRELVLLVDHGAFFPLLGGEALSDLLLQRIVVVLV